ncbi:hypothetical protein CEUSTIGMA_g937.t1 [Chlamydomonas eustigma]|uniref:Uncharacterized protein n=1 Tax=Chlamydomonas eustigma TaxID=1157962 RepID=A0A250WRM2_9CHLO|nr:hypothetical protein CEUSTIGMA_g937.t1 [Chlamydomonas eustigma]|eukprot:GAX73485.1 hypothetical protein CEUSTIGMA_g937.t1 [Chlamydomonas eustigma]
MLSQSRSFQCAARTERMLAPRVRISIYRGEMGKTQYTTVLNATSSSSGSGESPVRTALSSVVSSIFKVAGNMSTPEAGLSPLWQAIKRIDLKGVSAAVSTGADLNERDVNGDTPLLYISRAGHYKFPPAEIPSVLVKGGADMEAQDSKGMTALQVSLLSGWQNIAELLIMSGASTTGVPAIKSRLTCPDCRRIVSKYNL